MMKLVNVALMSSLLPNSRTFVYRELKKKGNLFYYFAESLISKYQEYVKEIDEVELISALEQQGFWEGNKTQRRFNNLINYISKRCLCVLATCYTGDLWDAERNLADILCSDTKIRNYLVEPFANCFGTTIDVGTALYRMRDSKENVDNCWHVPYDLRRYTVNYRFSLAGFPCLYLANSIETANKEMGTLKKGYKRWYSEFSPLGEQVYFDLNIHQEKYLVQMDNSDIINYLLTFPIRLLCSLPINSKDSFHEEYYIPQLMMYCLCVSENGNIRKYDGIAYSSTREKGGVNYVLPARYSGKRPPKDGLSQQLLKSFSASKPSIFK